jgi:hypothetical protein
VAVATCASLPDTLLARCDADHSIYTGLELLPFGSHNLQIRPCCNPQRKRNTAVATGTGYGLDDRVPVRLPRRLHRIRSHRPPTPGATSFRVKRPQREADHLPPTNAEVKTIRTLHRLLLPLTSKSPWRSAWSVKQWPAVHCNP